MSVSWLEEHEPAALVPLLSAFLNEEQQEDMWPPPPATEAEPPRCQQPGDATPPRPPRLFHRQLGAYPQSNPSAQGK